MKEANSKIDNLRHIFSNDLEVKIKDLVKSNKEELHTDSARKTSLPCKSSVDSFLLSNDFFSTKKLDSKFTSRLGDLKEKEKENKNKETSICTNPFVENKVENKEANKSDNLSFNGDAPAKNFILSEEKNSNNIQFNDYNDDIFENSKKVRYSLPLNKEKYINIGNLSSEKTEELLKNYHEGDNVFESISQGLSKYHSQKIFIKENKFTENKENSDDDEPLQLEFNNYGSSLPTISSSMPTYSSSLGSYNIAKGINFKLSQKSMNSQSSIISRLKSPSPVHIKFKSNVSKDHNDISTAKRKLFSDEK